MLEDGKIHSKEEIREETQSFLDEKRIVKGKDGTKCTGSLSPLGQKHTLTRWIKSAEDYYQNVLRAYQRPINDRFYLGDYITGVTVINAKREVEVMKEMRKELDLKYKGNIPR